MSLTTERLILRQWRDDDRPAFAALNADAVVMEFFPSTRSRKESDGVMDILKGHIDDHGFGFWALELRETGENIGFTGLQHVDFKAAFCPAIEIGWRLVKNHWGNGYASEAARASLDYGFDVLDQDRIVSFAVEANCRSRRVMERIGMIHQPEFDFDHPKVEPGSPLVRHAFYTISSDRRQIHLPPS